MHPSAALVLWLAGILAVQGLGYPGLLALLVLCFVAAPAGIAGWLAFVRRARWLLLTLGGVVAYHTPGDAIAGLTWAPTEQGVAEALLQMCRLVVMLGLLGWLYASQGRAGLVAGLWGLLRPLAALGLDCERVVVRLSLVLDNIQSGAHQAGWRTMLADQAGAVEGPESLSLFLPHWHWGDSARVLGAILMLSGVVLL